MYAAIGVVIGEIVREEMLQQFHLLREHVDRIGFGAGLQCRIGTRFRPRCTAEPEIDPPGIERGQHLEALRHLERAVMG